MAIKRRNKLIGQTTTVNTETQEEVIQPITIIENIVEQNITTNIQNIVQESVTNVVQNTTIVQMAVEENPAIAGALEKLATIESGAQVNPDISNLATKQEIPDITPLATKIEIVPITEKLATIQEGAQVNPDLTPITEAIGTKADAESMNTAFQSVNQSLSATEEVLTTHKENVANPHVTTKEQTGIRSQSGIIQFINESQKNILFTPNYFTKAPEVPLTLLDVDLTPPVRINVSKDGMTVKTKTRFTGSIGFIATEL